MYIWVIRIIIDIFIDAAFLKLSVVEGRTMDHLNGVGFSRITISHSQVGIEVVLIAGVCDFIPYPQNRKYIIIVCGHAWRQITDLLRIVCDRYC